MAINYGGSIANNYLLPQQAAQAPLAAAQPLNDGIEPMQGLQYVQGQTEGYYKKVAALKAFMQDVHTNLGIDVRVPDLSRPESIRLNQVFRDALADVQQEGNLLKNSQNMYLMAQQRGDQFFSDPTQQAFGTMVPQQDFSMRSAEPIVTEANDLMQQAHYLGAYDKAKQIYEDKVAYYDRKIQEEPEKAKYYEYQKNALVPPREGIKQFAPKSTYQDRNNARKVNAAGNMLKEIANLQRGVADGYTLDQQTVNPDSGNPMMTRPNFQQATYGGKRIKSWAHDPETAQTFLVFDDGTMQEVTTDNPLSLARGILGENRATFGVDAEYIEQYADQHGIYKDDGSINSEKLYRKDMESVAEQNKKTFAKDKSKANLQALKSFLESIQAGNSTIFSRSQGELNIKGAPEAVIIKKAAGSGKLYISNFEDAFPKPADKKKQEAWKAAKRVYGSSGDGVDVDFLKKFLQKYEFDLGNNLSNSSSGTPSAGNSNAKQSGSGKTATRAQIRKMLEKSPGYTEESLTKYYESQGYTIVD